METKADEYQFESTHVGRRVLLSNKMCQFRLQRAFAQMTLGHRQQIKMINMEQKSIRRRRDAILKRKREIEEARNSLPSPQSASIHPHWRLYSSAELSRTVYSKDVAPTPIRTLKVAQMSDAPQNPTIKMTEVNTLTDNKTPNRLRRFHSYAVPLRSSSDLTESYSRSTVRPQITRSSSNPPQPSFSTLKLPRYVCPHPVNRSASSASIGLALNPEEVSASSKLNSDREPNELPTVQRKTEDSLWNTKSSANKTSGRRFGVSG